MIDDTTDDRISMIPPLDMWKRDTRVNQTFGDTFSLRSGPIAPIDNAIAAYSRIPITLLQQKSQSLTTLRNAINDFKQQKNQKYAGGYTQSKRNHTNKTLNIDTLDTRIDRESERLTRLQVWSDINTTCTPLMDIKVADVHFSEFTKKAAGENLTLTTLAPGF